MAKRRHLQTGDAIWIFTDEHTFGDLPERLLLAPSPTHYDYFVEINQQPLKAACPIDFAVVRVGDIPAASKAQAIPKEFFAEQFSTVRDEPLFWGEGRGGGERRPSKPERYERQAALERPYLETTPVGQAMAHESADVCGVI